MTTSKKWVLLVLPLAVLFFITSGCDTGGSGGGVSSSRLFMPSGSGVTGAVTVSGGMTNTKEQMYWLAEALQKGGIIALAISASNNMAVSGYESAHKRGVEMIKSNSQIGKIGIMGFSMGGGAVVNLGNMADVDAVVAMAPFTPSPRSGHHAATMILTGTTDSTAPASMGSGAYNRLPQSVPRMYGSVKGVGHMHWMTSGSKGAEVDYIVAWAKYYLNGDQSAYSVFSNGGGSRLADYKFDPGDGPTGGTGGTGGGTTPTPGCN
jgi:hypothetical protein